MDDTLLFLIKLSSTVLIKINHTSVENSKTRLIIFGLIISN